MFQGKVNRLKKATPPSPLNEVMAEAKADAEAGEEERDAVEEEEDAAHLVEDYWDTIEQLPLEVARDFVLLKDLERQADEFLGSLKDDLLRYYAETQVDRSLPSSSPAPVLDYVEPVSTTEVPTSEAGLEALKASSGLNEQKSAESGEKPAGKPEVGEITEQSLAEILFRPEEEAQTLEINSASKGGSNRDLLTQISTSVNSLLMVSEEKHGLALATYNTVDRHIRRMDDALAALEETIVVGVRAGTGIGRLDGDGGLRTKFGGSDDDDHEREIKSRSSRKRKMKRKGQKRKSDGSEDEINLAEPRYCYCNKVSSGNMVACDNDDCEREWFHYDCVGITAPPKGSWFCKECIASLGPSRFKPSIGR